MIQPVYVRETMPLAVVSALEAIAPAAIATSSLYIISIIQQVEFSPYFVALAALTALLSLLLLRPHKDQTFVSTIGPLSRGMRLLLRWLALLGLLLAIGYATKFSSEYARRAILPWAFVTPVLIWTAELLLADLVRRLYLSEYNMRTAVIAGFNEAGAALAQRLSDHPELGIQMLGFFDDRGPARLGLEESWSHLGRLADMAEYVRTYNIDVVFIALPIRQIQRMMAQMDDLRNSTASLYYVPDIFVFDLIQSRTAEFMGIPVVAMCETPFHGFRGAIKRALDVAMTLAILTLIFPLLLTIAILIKLTSPGPVIFKQRRYGLDGKEILVYKFRSMTVTEDGPTIKQATKDDQRITSIGRILRRYSLDELPQLFNVLEGKMSLVGPRPHAVAHNEQYRQVIKGYMIRHKVLPGITGLAQINGCRGETEKLEQMESRVKYDLDYLRHWTPLLDIKIILKTALSLIRPDSRAY
jgi:Undecaprenyl-phosphate glucose phosphotransferase